MAETLASKDVFEVMQDDKGARIFDQLDGWQGIDLGLLRGRLRGGKIIDLLPVDNESLMLVIEDGQKNILVADVFAVQLESISKTLKGNRLNQRKLQQVMEQYIHTGKITTIQAQILELE